MATKQGLTSRLGRLEAALRPQESPETETMTQEVQAAESRIQARGLHSLRDKIRAQLAEGGYNGPLDEAALKATGSRWLAIIFRSDLDADAEAALAGDDPEGAAREDERAVNRWYRRARQIRRTGANDPSVDRVWLDMQDGIARLIASVGKGEGAGSVVAENGD
jgi:hypothetical protein